MLKVKNNPNITVFISNEPNIQEIVPELKIKISTSGTQRRDGGIGTPYVPKFLKTDILISFNKWNTGIFKNCIIKSPFFFKFNVTGVDYSSPPSSCKDHSSQTPPSLPQAAIGPGLAVLEERDEAMVSR